MKKGDLVFVYGTLRTGERMDLGSGFYSGMCNRIGDDTIKADLFDLGSFPGVKLGGQVLLYENEEPGTVLGEVFEITDHNLPMMLDSYEGYPNLYGRSQVETGGGRVVWVYTYNGRVNEDMLIVSGDWKSRVDRKAA